MPEPPANTPQQWRLSELNQSIDRLHREIAELEGERARLATSARKAKRSLAYLRLASKLRAPAASWVMWPTGVLAVGPLLAGIALLVVIDLLTGSMSLAILGLFVGGAIGAVALASLLFRPASSMLPSAIEETAAQLKLDESQLREVSDRLTLARGRQRDLIDERRELMASGKVQRAALLQREWKAMPEHEWEDFVVEVCRTLGASVERSPRSRERGASLIADFGDRRVVIVTTGEGHIVNSNAVQQALAAQKSLGTHRCAVIVNRRFTGAAQDFARHNGCVAIGLEEFPDFAMGKLTL
ncbi:MAG TPA: restriction endonuclease [Lacipirellula sp.]